ncbi:MAG: hypothetical protein QF769_06975 [Candidatus Marinimicrobia bacterium]|jgi:hypothetical protein|nr:hypothetical protein [Candidatus Neomarinimicrobiota bacterium]
MIHQYAVLAGVFISIIIFIVILGHHGGLLFLSLEDIGGAAVMIIIVAYMEGWPIGISLIIGFLILSVLFALIHKAIDRFFASELLKNFLFGNQPLE